MNTLKHDLRYALRTFLQNPISTGIAIAVLSLGIGANAAIFSVTNALLFRSLPYKDPGKLVFLWENKNSQSMKQEALSPPDYADFLKGNQVFEEMGAIHSRPAILLEGEMPERIETAAVSPAVFHLLGLQPALGRAFEPSEDQPARNHVAILSAGIWERRFGRDPNILGKTILLDSGSYSVVGVAPAAFRLPASPSELWIPYTPQPKDLSNRGFHELQVIAHLNAGVSLERAESAMRIIAERLAQEFPDTNAGFGVHLMPLRDQVIGDVRPTLWILTFAVAAVLIVACVNVAHLLLARASGREKEIAMRTALGASRGRLVQQLITESLTLALAAGVVGLLIAYWGIWILAKLVPDGLPQAGDIPMDWRVVAFTIGVSAVTGLTFGIIPALATARANLNLVLRSGGRGGTGARARTRLRDCLIVCEVASSAALLIGAGLFIHSLLRLQDVNPGYRPDHVLTMQLSLPQARYAGLQVGLFYKQLLDRVATLPGVEAAGICRFLPLSGSDASLNFQIEGQPPLRDADQPRAKFRSASGAYFASLGIPLLRGRLFDSRDSEQTPKVVIVNDTAARRYWPGEDPIGKRILSGFDENHWSTVIGVVGDVKHTGLDAGTNPETYYHYLQIPPEVMNFAEGSMALAIRTASDPAAITSSVRAEVRKLDSSQPVYNVRLMRNLVEGSVAQPKFRTLLVGTFAGAALLLAMLGLYGVVEYSVSQRTAELAIRIALGAKSSSILQLVVVRTIVLAAIGLLIGIGISLSGGRVMSRFLFGVTLADPMTLALTCVIVLLVALTASFFPALRATKVDPAGALRAE